MLEPDVVELLVMYENYLLCASQVLITLVNEAEVLSIGKGRLGCIHVRRHIQ